MNEATATIAPIEQPGPRQGPPLPTAGDVVAGRYEIVDVLGSGGYGVVFLSRDRRLKRDVALKVLRADRVSESALLRFRREAQVARDVESPHLLRIYDIGEADGLTFLSMEVVAGRSLKDLLADGPLSIEETTRIAVQVLGALEELHGRGIVHRDVKPGNILIAGDGAVKLADFGLARRWASDETRATRATSLIGTVEYLSPEQALGRDADPRTDLYSLGVVVYECLTGELPHLGDSSLGTVLGHLHGKTEDVRRRRPEVPRWLAAATARLLEKEPEDRFGSAAEARRAFAGRRMPVRYVLRLKGRRKVRPLGLVAAMLVAVALTAILMPLTSGEPKVAVNGGQLEASRRGRLLWSRSVASNAIVSARLRAGQTRRRAVTVLGDPTSPNVDSSTVSVLDLETGEVVDSFLLTSVAEIFGQLGFANHYGIELEATDIDADGLDELIVSYCHQAHWPSYSVLLEPALRLQRVVLVASGHHRFAGSADLNDDGEPELLFIGINNRLGWKTGLAAVDLVLQDQAHTPGDTFNQTRTALEWYVLLPADTSSLPGDLYIDASRKTIEVAKKFGGVTERIGFDGFRLDSSVSSGLSGTERKARRQEAYRQLHEAQRRLDRGGAGDAMNLLSRALEAATAAADDQLIEWLSRVESEALVAAGRPEEADRRFDKVAARSESPADIAFDAANAFHAAGYLELAVRWYKEGFGTGGQAGLGRGKNEILIGLLQALGELGRWQEARKEITLYGKLYPGGVEEFYRVYIRWRLREPIDLPPGHENTGNVDLGYYWILEARRARGEPPETLVPLAQSAMKRTSEERQTLVKAFLGWLLADAGRLPEGLSTIRQAHAELQAHLPKFPAARAHYDLVTHRYADLARRAGHDGEAAAAEQELEAWRHRQLPRYGFLPERWASQPSEGK